MEDGNLNGIAGGALLPLESYELVSVCILSILSQGSLVGLKVREACANQTRSKGTVIFL